MYAGFVWFHFHLVSNHYVYAFRKILEYGGTDILLLSREKVCDLCFI